MATRTASTRYTVGVIEKADAEAANRGRLAEAIERLPSRARRTSLYLRVVLINAAIVAGATVVLVVTPATVGYPISLTEALVLVVGVVCVVIANALVLRLSFGGLARTVARMETVDLLRPQERLPLTGGPETRAVVAGLNQMLARLEAERRESSRRTLAAPISSSANCPRPHPRRRPPATSPRLAHPITPPPYRRPSSAASSGRTTRATSASSVCGCPSTS